MNAAEYQSRLKAENANSIQSVQNQQRLDGVMNPFLPPDFTVTGSNKEVEGKLDGLERARILTGQSPYQVGQEYQEAFGNIKKRTTNSDTASELLRANKAGAVADAKNQLKSDGVKGGAALGAVSQIERAKSYDVNNQLAQNARQAETDYMNAAKANANFTQASEMNYGALAAGKDVKAPTSYSSGFGTVICTELFKQGYYPLSVYEADQSYGLKMMNEKPHIYTGYRFMADPVVSLMQKSRTFTKFVAFFALPWALNMAGEKNVLGAVISMVGEPVCGFIGKTIIKIGDKSHGIQKA